MTDKTDPAAETAPVAATPADTTVSAADQQHRPNRLYQAAAWVAIVAGTIFIVGTVFFAGMVVGHRADGHGPHRGGHDSGMHHRGHMGPGGPMMGGGCPMMKGNMGPGRHDAGAEDGDGRGGPGQDAPTPSAPRPAPPAGQTPS